ncbi:hypothetical protein BH09PLA1_BH09PLA1_02440 [soil metagenome]
MKPIQTVGVIGAGIAGLACAEALRRSGLGVTVVEKARGVGGRMATRRTDSGATFDHGAQYFTARDPLFASQVEQWCAGGCAALWNGRIVTLNQGVTADLADAPPRFVGVPGMSSVAKMLATGLHVQLNVSAQSIRRLGGSWHVEDAAGKLYGPFDFLISSAPPQQTRSLFGDESSVLAKAMSNVIMAPCWAVMLELPKRMEVSFDAAFVNESPLSWISRNSSKPKRDTADCWVLHASATWSREHLDQPADAVAQMLVERLWRATGQAPLAIHAMVAHRWRYALPVETLPQRCLIDRDVNLGWCGDWCGGPRVEGAYLSGLAMADALPGSVLSERASGY